MILTGELAIGAKLNEVALAERLGVSRGPVREAFRALEESGLVHLEKNRGVFVRQISVEEADEIYEVRATLDEWVGRRLAQTATAGQVKELKAIVERMDHATGEGRRIMDFHGNNVHQVGYRHPHVIEAVKRALDTLPFSPRRYTNAAAGKALHDHVMGSRTRMHRSRAAGGSAARHVVVNTPRQSR